MLMPKRDSAMMRMIGLLALHLLHGKGARHRLSGRAINRPEVRLVGLIDHIAGERLAVDGDIHSAACGALNDESVFSTLGDRSGKHQTEEDKQRFHEIEP